MGAMISKLLPIGGGFWLRRDPAPPLKLRRGLGRDPWPGLERGLRVLDLCRGIGLGLDLTLTLERGIANRVFDIMSSIKVGQGARAACRPTEKSKRK